MEAKSGEWRGEIIKTFKFLCAAKILSCKEKLVLNLTNSQDRETRTYFATFRDSFEQKSKRQSV